MRSVQILLIFLTGASILSASAYAQTDNNTGEMLNLANAHFVKGEYKEAIRIYDDILDTFPDNISALKMKGIAHSNIEEHQESLRQFFVILQHRPNDVIALSGMGLGFGNLGEYQESIMYFDRALEQQPDSIVLNNYRQVVKDVISKYPYMPTEKPRELEEPEIEPIPDWIRNLAGWWAKSLVTDDDFVNGIEYLIANRIIQIPEGTSSGQSSDSELPSWPRDSAGRWAEGIYSDKEFLEVIWWLMDNGLVSVDIQPVQKTQEELDSERYFFDRYLREITKNISKEKRYIEFPNPSRDVIKKFLRDYVKWNFEEEAKKASEKFPDPTYEIIDDKYVISYKVYINEQPTGLPLDHVGTLRNSLEFWESQELSTNNQKAKVKFEITNKRYEANVWVTWVVRNLGDGVLGHAHLGKGIVEVALGDYRCDGSFQLYDVESVEAVMTHELGHSIGLQHTEDRTSIMFPSYSPSYAYCLLG